MFTKVAVLAVLAMLAAGCAKKSKAGETCAESSSCEGELRCKDGKCFSPKNGQATFTYPNGMTYVGEWKDDKRHGQGTYTFPEGTRYVGEFKDDKVHGQGTTTSPDGTTYVGEWKDGELVVP